MRTLYVLAIWWLVIMVYKGGTTAIPQISKESCLSNARWIEQQLPIDWSNGSGIKAVCIEGLSPGNPS